MGKQSGMRGTTERPMQANIVVNSYSELILALNPAIFPCCCSCCCCWCCLCSPQFACPSKKRTNFACMSVEYIVWHSILATGTAPRNKLNRKLCHMLNKQPIHVYKHIYTEHKQRLGLTTITEREGKSGMQKMECAFLIAFAILLCEIL